MRKSLLLALVLGVSLFVFAHGIAFGSEVLTLRVGHGTQVTHPAHLATAKFAELVKEKSNGQMVIEVFPARQLGDDGELLEQAMNGTLEMANVPTSIFSKYTPALDVLQLPFLLSNYEKELKAILSDEFKEILSEIEALGLKPLCVNEWGIRHLANNVRPINKPEDLAGLKMRVVPSAIVRNTISALGGNPTPMAYGEVYTALHTKVLDGEEINYTSVFSEKHYEVIKFFSDIGLFPFPGFLVMHKETYEKLTDDQKNVLEESAKEIVFYVKDLLTDLDRQSTETMIANGIEITYVKDLEPFKEKVKPIYEEYSKKGDKYVNFIRMAEKL